MRQINFDEPRKRTHPSESKEEKLIKNQECVSCKNLFTCKGKPRGIDKCLNYMERKSQYE